MIKENIEISIGYMNLESLKNMSLVSQEFRDMVCENKSNFKMKINMKKVDEVDKETLYKKIIEIKKWNEDIIYDYKIYLILGDVIKMDVLSFEKIKASQWEHLEIKQNMSFKLLIFDQKFIYMNLDKLRSKKIIINYDGKKKIDFDYLDKLNIINVESLELSLYEDFKTNDYRHREVYYYHGRINNKIITLKKMENLKKICIKGKYNLDKIICNNIKELNISGEIIIDEIENSDAIEKIILDIDNYDNLKHWEMMLNDMLIRNELSKLKTIKIRKNTYEKISESDVLCDGNYSFFLKDNFNLDKSKLKLDENGNIIKDTLDDEIGENIGCMKIIYIKRENPLLSLGLENITVKY